MALFPGALPVAGSASSTATLAAAGHTALHNTDRDEIRAVATKVGTGDSTPASGTVLRGTGAGTSAWGSVSLTDDVTGTLPVTNGGTGAATAAEARTSLGINTALETLALAYPIGSIYINASDSVNPATLLGFGTWAEFGAGRVMVGLDSGQTEFDSAGETGGSKTHTLSAAESGLPAHFHNYKFGDTAGGDGSALAFATTDGTTNVETGILSTTGAAASSAHNNLQPYIVVYMWRRTA